LFTFQFRDANNSFRGRNVAGYPFLFLVAVENATAVEIKVRWKWSQNQIKNFESNFHQT